MLVAGFVLQVVGLAGISQAERTTGYGQQVGFLVAVGVGLAAAGLRRAASGSVVAGLAQGIAPAAEPQRRIGQEAFSAAAGDGLLLGVGAAVLGLLLSLWVLRRLRASPSAV